MIKHSVNDLAVFGGSPVFSRQYHVGQINMPSWDDFHEQFSALFQRRYFTNHGPLVRSLEERVADYLGVTHAVCVTNGTLALMITAKALGLEGEVIVPSFTFPATVQALTWAGLTPVFCDVSPVTHCLTAELVEPLISEKTSAILGVHLWGKPCAPDDLHKLAEHHGLSLFFDAAHAFGCSFSGKKAGGFGQAETFSFHATKILNGVEGGCITTNDDHVAAAVRTIRNFHDAETLVPVSLRINGKMTEAQAAMALLSLDDMDKNNSQNRDNYESYHRYCSDIPGLSMLDQGDGYESNYQYAVFAMDEEESGIGRDILIRCLASENIIARRYFHPGVHCVLPYRSDAFGRDISLPVTERLSQMVFQLPNNSEVTEGVIRQICELIRYIVAHADEIGSRDQLAGNAVLI